MQGYDLLQQASEIARYFSKDSGVTKTQALGNTNSVSATPVNTAVLSVFALIIGLLVLVLPVRVS